MNRALLGVAEEKQIGSYRSLTTGGASTEGKFYLQDGKLLYRSSRTTGTASLSEGQGKTVLRVMPADPTYGAGSAEYEADRVIERSASDGLALRFEACEQHHH